MADSQHHHSNSTDSATGVLIVGGGVAGLALANYLARYDYDPTIVEQRTDWTGSGYGIGLWAVPSIRTAASPRREACAADGPIRGRSRVS